MSGVFLTAIAIRIAAFIYSFVLLLRQRDLRLASICVMYATIIVRPVYVNVSTNGLVLSPISWADDLFALFLSVLAFAAIYLLETIVTENRQTLQRLNDAQRHAKIGSFEWDRRLRTRLWSESLYGIYGIDPGTAIDDTTIQTNVHPDDTARLAELFERALVGSGSFGTVYRVRNASGSWKNVVIRGEVELDAKGAVRRLYGTVQDISEQHAVEEALRLSETALAEANRMLENVLDALPVAVYWKNRDLAYLGCNRIFARDADLQSPSQVVGKTDYDLPWREEADRYRSNDWRVIESGRALPPIEFATRTKNFDTVWVRLIIAPLLDGSGQCIGVLGAYEDITAHKRSEHDRTQLEGQLIRAQKMESVGQLAGGVAHDFNNLLVAMLGYAELGEQNSDTPPNLRRYFAEIRRVSEKAAELTRQLLALGRRQVLRFEALELNDLIHSMTGMLQRVLPETIELAFTPAPVPAIVWGDAGQLQQVVLNLVINARDAMPRGGSVRIETAVLHSGEETGNGKTAASESVELRVRDTGAGIKPEDMPSIFEPFYTTKPEGKGTGLGLAVVLGVIEQHHGKVTVESSPGRGTEFRIRLKFATGEPAKSPTALPGLNQTGSETILLVEDNETVRALTRELLENAGYHVLLADDGEEAVTSVRKNPDSIDLVLMDVVMPKMSGPEAFDHIRALHPDMPVVFTSGYAMDNLPAGFLTKHKLELIPKPFQAKALLDTVRNVLDAPLSAS